MVPINLDYDPDFLKEEVRDGYTVSEEMKKLWLVELDILNKFIQVCDKYGLTYFADAGTLLGTVRHNGFIPWDDDVDVIMPRKDYDKLQEIAKDEFKYPYYFECPKNSYAFSFSSRIRRLDTTRMSASVAKEISMENRVMTKIPYAISIDIFCLDNCPDDQQERNKYQMMISKLATNYFMTLHRFNAIYHNPRIDKDTYDKYKESIKTSFDRFNNVCQKYDNIETEHMYNSSFAKTPMPSYKLRLTEDYAESIYLPFEMLTLRCPKGYDRCLKIMYTNRNGVPWQEPVQNFALHNQGTKKFMDFDNSYQKYTIWFYNKPEDKIKTSE